MTAPALLGSPANTLNTSPGSSHAINLPSGITSGELLLTFFTIAIAGSGSPPGAAPSVSIPGWGLANGTWYRGTYGVAGYVYYRNADGSEGSTVSASFGESAVLTAITTRVSIPVLNPTSYWLASVRSLGTNGSLITFGTGNSHDTLVFQQASLTDINRGGPQNNGYPDPPPTMTILGQVHSTYTADLGDGVLGSQTHVAYRSIDNMTSFTGGSWAYVDDWAGEVALSLTSGFAYEGTEGGYWGIAVAVAS